MLNKIYSYIVFVAVKKNSYPYKILPKNITLNQYADMEADLNKRKKLKEVTEEDIHETCLKILGGI